jgi:hypothetical protein
VSLSLRDVAGLPNPDVRPPTIAESGDPFASLRVAHLVARVPQLQSNWMADFRTQHGFDLADGPAGEELTIEESGRVEPWLVRQVERYADACRERLLRFARDEGAVP